MLVEVESQRILVVEDEERIASLLQRQLGAAGFEVQTTGRGSEALTAVETRRPDLIILDLGLPDISGYELCWILRRLYDHATLPIVILTGLEQCTDDLQREAVGADAYLRKPYDVAGLVQTLRRLLPPARSWPGDISLVVPPSSP